jgi:hypothetical protein
MSLPTGWSIRVRSITANFDPNGTDPSCHIAFDLLDPTNTIVGSRFHSLTQDGPIRHDPIAGDGTTASFTTTAAPYSGSRLNVILDGNLQTSGYTTSTNANGTITVTFTTAPAKGTKGNLNYGIGPGLANNAGDLPAVLGLASSSGPVYSGKVGGAAMQTSHQKIADLAAMLVAWAQVRVMDDVFS